MKLKKNFLQHSDIKSLFKNIFSISVVRIFDYLLPILVIPYVVRIIGVTNFGKVSVAQSFISYFSILINFGFNYSITREIAINREDKKKLSSLFSTTIFIKLGFFFISILLIGISIFSIKTFKEEFTLFLFSSIVLLGDVLFPIWLFQGLEILDYVAKITIPTRIFFTALIFLLVKEPTDYIFIPLLYSLGPLISGVIGIFIANSKLNVKFVFPSIYEIKSLIKEGFLYFLSRASITFYNSTNVILVKFILGDFYAGLYAAASKLIKALRRVLQPLYISIFPYFSKKERMMSKKYRKLNMLILFSTTFLITFISGIVFISSDVIIKTFFGDKFLLSVKILKILILSIPFYHIAAYIGASILVPFGFKKTFNYSVIIPSFFHLFILLVIYLLKLNNNFIVAATVVFTQIFISLIRIGKLFIVNKEKGKY